MCQLLVGLPHLADGWGCCRCKAYNGLWRGECKACGTKHCEMESERGERIEPIGDEP